MHSPEMVDQIIAAVMAHVSIGNRVADDAPATRLDVTGAKNAVRAILDALAVDEERERPDGSPFIWKWVERAIFDDALSEGECLSTLAEYPNAPWNLGRWDVDHKPYAERFYRRFPNARAALTQSDKEGVK